MKIEHYEETLHALADHRDKRTRAIMDVNVDRSIPMADLMSLIYRRTLTQEVIDDIVRSQPEAVALYWANANGNAKKLCMPEPEFHELTGSD